MAWRWFQDASRDFVSKERTLFCFFLIQKCFPSFLVRPSFVGDKHLVPADFLNLCSRVACASSPPNITAIMRFLEAPNNKRSASSSNSLPQLSNSSSFVEGQGPASGSTWRQISSCSKSTESDLLSPGRRCKGGGPTLATHM